MASPFPKVARVEELVQYCEEIASGAPELPFYYYHILDPVIHAQAKLRIMATLAGLPRGDEMVFPRLRELLGMTAGNLSMIEIGRASCRERV